MRPLLRGHGRHQAGDEQPPLDRLCHRLHVRLCLCRLPDVYQLGGLVTGEVSFNLFTIVALVLLAGLLYLLFRKNPYEDSDGVRLHRKAVLRA